MQAHRGAKLLPEAWRKRGPASDEILSPDGLAASRASLNGYDITINGAEPEIVCYSEAFRAVVDAGRHYRKRAHVRRYLARGSKIGH